MAHFLSQEFPNAWPDPWQVAAISSDAQTVALLVCRQAGKSCVLATRGVRELETGGTTICLAPAERQTREITRKVTQYLRCTDLVIERATQTEIETNNGGRFIAVPASGATIRGYTADLLLVDEMAYLPGHNGGEDVVVALLPMLKDDGQTFYASTPAGKKNMFASLFLEPSPDVHRIKVPGTSIPRLNARVERLRNQLSATRFRQEVMCEFLSDGTSYFDLSVIERAINHEKKAICPQL
ncbi:MAG: terminase family protein [Pelagimonas sp.]|nr:terminase family protein [Pelagimonas sp.]